MRIMRRPPISVRCRAACSDDQEPRAGQFAERKLQCLDLQGTGLLVGAGRLIEEEQAVLRAQPHRPLAGRRDHTDTGSGIDVHAAHPERSPGEPSPTEVTRRENVVRTPSRATWPVRRRQPLRSPHPRLGKVGCRASWPGRPASPAARFFRHFAVQIERRCRYRPRTNRR